MIDWVEGIMVKNHGNNDGKYGKMKYVPTICMHVPNLTLVMLGATLAHLYLTLELRIK
jgi:hypothetical protein